MGQTVNKPQKLIKAYIHPVPGTSGCSFKKPNVLSVYTDKEIISLKITKDMTGTQLKSLLFQKTGTDYTLHVNHHEIPYSKTITELGLTEKTLIQAITPSKNPNTDKSSFTKSTLISHRRTQSANCSGINLEVDLSVYAVPEVKPLKNNNKKKMKTNHNRRCSNFTRFKLINVQAYLIIKHQAFNTKAPRKGLLSRVFWYKGHRIG